MAKRDVTGWHAAESAEQFWAPIYSLRRELDRLFDNFLSPGETRLFRSKGVQPSIEVDETDEGYSVTAELPGLNQNDIQVDLQDNVLRIAGEKREEHEENKAGRCYSERSYGMFERRIPLGFEVDPEKVDARFTNGVLRIELQKSPNAKAHGRRIEIKS